jgi:phage-related minor tail protein
MSDSEKQEFLQRDIFDVHMRYIQTSLDNLRDISVKVVDRLEIQERTLYRNTITVEDHKQRSLHIEERQEEFITALRSIKDDITDIVFKVKDLEDELKPMKDKADMNAKFIGQILWVRNNQGLIFKLAVACSITSIIMYILLKDVEAIKQLLKVIF